jgi:predicted lipoprotein with Yx(FWY)xxD motif
MRNRLFMISGLASVALFAAACGSSTSGAGAYGSGPTSPAASASSPAAAGGQANNAKTVMLKTRTTSLGKVVTNASGFTLYWYAPDTSTSSKCTGSCAAAWPPVDGNPQAAMGVSLPGALGTITRAGGVMQATYQGHPLYLYASDSAPGMTTGNGAGGAWHVMLVSGASGGSMSSPTQSSSGSGGGGYGY